MNNKELFIDYYRNNYNKIQVWIKFNYPNLNNIEDFLNDTILKFYENYLNDYDPTICSIKTYFINYVKLQALYTIKNNKTLLSLDNENEEGNTFAEQLEDVKEFDNVDELLDIVFNKIIPTLKEKEKTYFNQLLLTHKKGYKIAAEELNLNINSLKSRITHIRDVIGRKYYGLTGVKMEFRKTMNKKLNNMRRYKKTKKIL